jgi:hypothetical protein
MVGGQGRGFNTFDSLRDRIQLLPVRSSSIPKWGAIALDLPILGFADIFVSMKTISKRELVRNPSLASHLKPGQSLQLEDGKEPLVLSRRKRTRLTAEQIHAELDRLCEGAPEHDTQAALRDLRQ